MTKKIIELAPNVKLIVSARYYCVHQEGDIMADIASYHDEGVKIQIDLNLNGKILEDGDRIFYANNSKWKNLANVPEEVETVLIFHGKEPVKIQLRKEKSDLLAATIAEATAEEAPEEYKKKVEAKAEKEKQNEIKKCEKIIEECEKVIEKSGKLMTEKEAKEWLKNYNNVINEGGEGYLPRIYTLEEFENAKKKLEDLKK